MTTGRWGIQVPRGVGAMIIRRWGIRDPGGGRDIRALGGVGSKAAPPPGFNNAILPQTAKPKLAVAVNGAMSLACYTE